MRHSVTLGRRQALHVQLATQRHTRPSTGVLRPACDTAHNVTLGRQRAFHVQLATCLAVTLLRVVHTTQPRHLYTNTTPFHSTRCNWTQPVKLAILGLSYIYTVLTRNSVISKNKEFLAQIPDLENISPRQVEFRKRCQLSAIDRGPSLS